MEEKYSLIGVDGNAYAVMGYVSNALRECGYKDDIEKYYTEATSSNYDNLLAVSVRYIDKCNGIYY